MYPAVFVVGHNVWDSGGGLDSDLSFPQFSEAIGANDVATDSTPLGSDTFGES